MPVRKSEQGKPLGGIGAENQSTRRHALVLDDRLLSKQYITNKLDDRIDDTVYGIGWDGVTDRAPSVNAVYDKINSLGTISDIWGQEDATASTTDVRFKRTGNFGIGNGSSLAFDDITEKLYVDGNIKATGDFISTGDASIGDDLSLISDASILNFGVNSDVNLTHVHDTGLLLNSSRQLQFGDSGTYIHQSADGVLDLVADTEIEINATTIDMNGAADISGNLGVGGNITVSGNLTISGTATSLDTQQITAEDPFILINSLGTAQDAGIEVERTGLDNVSLRWNNTGATTGQWEFTNDGSTFTAIGSGGGSGTITSFTNGVDNRIVTASGTATLNGEATLTFDGTDLTHTTTSTAGGFTLAGTNGSSGNTVLDITGGDSSSSNAAVSIEGHLEATTKSFNIPHPLLDNKRLVYGSLEGPEHGMYQRGSFDIEDERRIVAIDLPVYWSAMTYEDYTVNLTTYGDYNVWISNRDENGFWVETNAEKEWSFDWSVIAGRKDAKLVVEPDA